MIFFQYTLYWVLFWIPGSYRSNKDKEYMVYLCFAIVGLLYMNVLCIFISFKILKLIIKRLKYTITKPSCVIIFIHHFSFLLYPGNYFDTLWFPSLGRKTYTFISKYLKILQNIFLQYLFFQTIPYRRTSCKKTRV